MNNPPGRHKGRFAASLQRKRRGLALTDTSILVFTVISGGKVPLSYEGCGRLSYREKKRTTIVITGVLLEGEGLREGVRLPTPSWTERLVIAAVKKSE